MAVGGGVGIFGLAGSGCGGSTANTTGTGGNTMKTTVHTSASSSSSGTGGMGGSSGGCHQFSCAVPIMVGAKMATAGTLVDPTTPDYYSFQGKKGDRFILQATAVGLIMNPPADTSSITDTVVTLYLPDMTKIWAFNDDAWPRLSTDSTLWTELPMDGTYYFTVNDCNALAAVNSNVTCAPPNGIMTFDYQVFVNDITMNHTETVGTAGTTTTVMYTPIPMMTGQFFDPVVDGDIAMQADVQKFTLTPPAFKPDPAARARAYFWVQSYGASDGTGTALDVVVTAKDKNGNVLGKSDQQWYTNGDDPMNNSLQFAFPIDDQFGNTATSTYNLEVSVSNKTGIMPMQNYYIMQHHMGPFYLGQPELEKPDKSGPSNDASPGEVLKAPTGVTGGFFIDGNLTTPADVDWYNFTVPGAAKLLGFSCASARDGSGVLGFTAEIFKDMAGTMSLGKVGPEVTTPGPKVDLNGPAKGITITGGATYYLKVSATGQDAVNMGTYYNCSFNAQ
jgi:hypothetical protein